jgi:hypothetical protein
MYTEPDRPLFAVPVPMYMLPLLPTLDVPVLRVSRPLTPDGPALAVLKRKEPLEVTVLYPLIIEVRPPDSDVEVPADRIRSPPVPLSPEPTAM